MPMDILVWEAYVINDNDRVIAHRRSDVVEDLAAFVVREVVEHGTHVVESSIWQS
jgi:hypothetical protein